MLLATSGFAFVVIGQLRALQSSFDLLTTVYVVFNQRLAAAHVQAVRIHAYVEANEQVRGRSDADRVGPETGRGRADSTFLAVFEAGLELRNDLVRDASRLIDDAIAHRERFQGARFLDDLRELRKDLDEVETLIASDESREPEVVLRDARNLNRIQQSLQALEHRTGRAIVDLQFEVRDVQQRTERITLALTLGVAALGVLAAIGVFWTLGPLRRLTQAVRRLGAGDWSQRIGANRLGGGDEVAQLAEEFNLMTEALEERETRLIRGARLAAAGRLAAQVAHEIRNPLSSVGLNVELLEDELEGATPEAHRLLTRISSEVDRLAGVTEDYLSIARSSNAERVPLDLAAELTALLDFLAEEHGRAGITVKREIPGAAACVMGDAGQLRQAFMNLLRNAQEAVLGHVESTAPPTIVVTVRCKGDRVEAVVRDNGGGIPLPEEELERIFEAFYTDKTHGTGLGLPIVQQIVQEHGGAVRLAETGPSGTAFVISLPACDPGDPSVSSPPDSGPPRGAHSDAS